MTVRVFSGRMFCIVPIVCALVASSAHVCGADISPDEDPVFNVPKVDNLALDQQPLGWDENALNVNSFCCVKGTPWPKSTPAPSMRVAWNAMGLLAAVTVHHAHPWEYDYVRHLFKGDSVEFFVSPRKGSRDRYMLIVSPGLDPRYPQPRYCFFPDPSEAAERDVSDLTFQCSRVKTSDGYKMQVLLPWSNLHLQPSLGMELALQVYVMEAEPNAPPVVGMWNPTGESFIDPRSTQRIRLTDKPGLPVVACATAQDDTEQKVRTIRIVAPLDCAGKQFEVRSEEAGVAYGSLVAAKTQSFATLSLPVGQVCKISLNDVPVPLVVIPPQNDLATIMTQSLKCKFESCVFRGEQFPGCYVEGARHYHVSGVTFYDADYRLVTSAVQPGRYGAVVDIADVKGKITRRFRTLFRIPDSPGLWQASAKDLKVLPHLLAIDSVAQRFVPLDAGGHQDLTFLQQDDPLANPDTAALAACLFAAQTKSLHDDVLMDFRSMDRQWWVGLKRKLYGWDRQFPTPFVGPAQVIINPAIMVHDGTDQEAGVIPKRVEQLDQICRGIVGDVGEPVSICLVRHGVVFFHHAYGQLNGRPFTVDDPGDIMSATKALGGALMMQVLDRGLIAPDETIDKVVPCFGRIPVKREMTIRDLYTHLNGLIGDWGDQIHDTEEIVSGYYPTVDVGNYSYNEVGFALGGKIIEAVTGEAFPQFAKRHLLSPLGMDHTRVTNSGGHNATTSLDYAKFGQMLLNKGSYGNMRFFSEKTFEDMLPSSDGSNRRGMGIVWLNWQKYGFASGSFGHNAGNSSMLAVDPAHDLVVVIVSGGGRKDFAGQADAFYHGVINALQ